MSSNNSSGNNSGTLKNIKLVMYNLPAKKEIEFRPSVEQTRSRLRDANLPDNYAEDIAESTAFRRACDQCRAPDIEARCFKGADEELYVQVERLIRDKDETSAKLQRALCGVWRHTVHGPVQVRDYNPTIHDILTNEYQVAKTTYEFADLGRMIQQILVKEGLGIYSPRRAGGVYFAPMDESCLDLLDRLDRFCSASSIRLLQYDIPDTESQRQEIGEAIAAGLAVEVAQHREAVESYSPHTRPDTFAYRRAVMAQTTLLLIRLREYLNGHAQEMANQLDQLEAKMKEHEAAANSAVPMGRRVMAR